MNLPNMHCPSSSERLILAPGIQSPSLLDADRSKLGLARSIDLVAQLFCALIVLAGPLAQAADAGPSLAAPPEPIGMKALFNGKDLAGWEGDPRLWSVKEGAIRGQTTPDAPAKGNTFLILKDQHFSDFELRLSFRCTADNNSGIQYRSKHITDGNLANNWVVRGYQHEIRNENTLPSVTGFIYDEGGKRGRMCLAGEKVIWENGKKNLIGTLLDAEGYKRLFHLDDWNDVVIVAEGNHMRHFLNGTLILDFTDADPQLALKEGIIALQLHAGKPMWTEFKNIRIKVLTPQAQP